METHWKLVAVSFAIGLAAGVAVMSGTDGQGRLRPAGWAPGFASGSGRPPQGDMEGQAAATPRTADSDAPAATLAAGAGVSMAGPGASGRAAPSIPAPNPTMDSGQAAGAGPAGFIQTPVPAQPQPGAAPGAATPPGSERTAPPAAAGAAAGGGPKVVVYGSTSRQHLMGRGMPRVANIGENGPAPGAQAGGDKRRKDPGFGSGSGRSGSQSRSEDALGAGDGQAAGGAGDGYAADAGYGGGSRPLPTGRTGGGGSAKSGAGPARAGGADSAAGSGAPQGSADASQDSVRRAAGQAAQQLQQGQKVIDDLTHNKQVPLPPDTLRAINGQFQNARSEIQSAGADAAAAADDSAPVGDAKASPDGVQAAPLKKLHKKDAKPAPAEDLWPAQTTLNK